jgi:hypothetical protein
VHEPYETPLGSISDLSVLRGNLFLNAPVMGKNVHSDSNSRAERKDPGAVLPSELGT